MTSNPNCPNTELTLPLVEDTLEATVSPTERGKVRNHKRVVTEPVEGTVALHQGDVTVEALGLFRSDDGKRPDQGSRQDDAACGTRGAISDGRSERFVLPAGLAMSSSSRLPAYAMAGMGGNSYSGNTYIDLSDNRTVTITQVPGKSGEAFYRRFVRQMDADEFDANEPV